MTLFIPVSFFLLTIVRQRVCRHSRQLLLIRTSLRRPLPSTSRVPAMTGWLGCAASWSRKYLQNFPKIEIVFFHIKRHFSQNKMVPERCTSNLRENTPFNSLSWPGKSMRKRPLSTGAAQILQTKHWADRSWDQCFGSAFLGAQDRPSRIAFCIGNERTWCGCP
jgi:hypothetical protein